MLSEAGRLDASSSATLFHDAFGAGTAELDAVRTAFPRAEGEKGPLYARRINLASQQGHRGALVNGQPLTISQLAVLSGIKEWHLREDPQLKALPLELAPVRAAFPRGENEKALPYARRLYLASQQGHRDAQVNGQPLTLSQLASLSGAKQTHLRQDAQLKALPLELAPVRAAFPRREGEKALPYACRLHQASRRGHLGALVNGQPLTLSQLANLSGSHESVLRLDPRLKVLPVELEAVLAALPRHDGESAYAYARRLNLTSRRGHPGTLVDGQPLTLSQVASLSGATEVHLRDDPQLKALPLELAPVRAAFPRGERESSIAYARRLNLTSQKGHRDALVNGQALTLSQLASLSGTKESLLRGDPQLKALPLELAPVRAAFPRGAKEKARPYARRLNLASQQGLAGALVNGQTLTLSQLASLSGATEPDLRQDSRLKALPLELAPVRAAFPRGEREAAAAFARRLNLASQRRERGALVNDQPLTLSQLASLSGAAEFTLRQDPQLSALPIELVPVRAAFPRREGEKALPYARRLNLASQRREPGALVDGQPLTLSQLTSLSGAKHFHLRQDSQLTALPVELAPVREAFPRGAREPASVYARWLNAASQQWRAGALVNGQTLTLSQLASLSGATQSDLRKHLRREMLPPAWAQMQATFEHG